MLSPEVLDFPAPSNYFSVQESTLNNDENVLNNVIQNHYFNKGVVIVLPNRLNVPESLKSTIYRDSQYYKLHDCPIHLFTSTDFIEGFVNSGEVTACSFGAALDQDNCAVLTPTGQIVLSVQRETFHSLGIDKSPAVSIIPGQEFSQIVINLKEDCFKRGKKNYERVRKQLILAEELRFTFLLQWEPKDEKVCPSSIAAYFASSGLNIEECSLTEQDRKEYNVVVPSIDCSPEELLEWMGALCLDIRPSSENSTEEFLSSYTVPENNENFGQVSIVQCTGLISSRRIAKTYSLLKSILSNATWSGLYVHGFEDSPVNWGTKRHHFHSCGDNSYAVFIDTRKIVSIEIFTSPAKKKSKKK